MKRLFARSRRAACLMLLAALLLGGCDGGGYLTIPLWHRQEPEAVIPADPQIEQALDAQLGLLTDYISGEERARALELLAELWPLRQKRLEENRFEPSGGELELASQLNALYEEYTIAYLGDGGAWGYGHSSARQLARFAIDGQTGIIRALPTVAQIKKDTPIRISQDHQQLWDEICSILPQEALTDFSYFVVWTDGPDNTLAYVQCLDETGETWEIAVDPADAEERDELVETLIHEYSHYLTLNQTQVWYTEEQTADTYNEEGMISKADSYLNQFYQRFWSLILDDRMADTESYNFYLRHEREFVSPYASTDPAEDICESFAAFVLWDRPGGDSVADQKVRFFYEFPELVELRRQFLEQIYSD